jgi:hypothetical protein
VLERVAINLFALAVGIVLLFIILPKRPPAARAWARAARILGLEVRSESVIAGRIGGLSVCVDFYSDNWEPTRFRVEPVEHSLPPIRFGPQSAGERAGHPLGEPGFDRVLALGGPVGPATALDFDARRAVRQLVLRHGGTLVEGVLQARAKRGDRGGLSVIDPEAEDGRLSMVDDLADARGGVSLAGLGGAKGALGRRSSEWVEETRGPVEPPPSVE